MCINCEICVSYLRDGICTFCRSDHTFASVGSVWSACSAHVSSALICMICTICLMFAGTYLYDLQFQVDPTHNLHIHGRRKVYRGVKRPHTCATCVGHIINFHVMISIFRGRYCWFWFTVYLCMIYSPHHTSVMFSCWDLCDTAITSAHTSAGGGLYGTALAQHLIIAANIGPTIDDL